MIRSSGCSVGAAATASNKTSRAIGVIRDAKPSQAAVAASPYSRLVGQVDRSTVALGRVAVVAVGVSHFEEEEECEGEYDVVDCDCVDTEECLCYRACLFVSSFTSKTRRIYTTQEASTSYTSFVRRRDLQVKVSQLKCPGSAISVSAAISASQALTVPPIAISITVVQEANIHRGGKAHFNLRTITGDIPNNRKPCTMTTRHNC